MCQQLVSDTTSLVTGRHEQLLDDERPIVTAQRDISGRSTLLACDEDHIVLEHLEYSLVAPAGHAGERDLCKPEQLRQISLDPRNDLDLRRQPKPPSASIAPTSGRQEQCYNPILMIARPRPRVAQANCGSLRSGATTTNCDPWRYRRLRAVR